MTLEEQIKEVEDEIQKTPVNKASEHHLGKLKAKLARLKVDLTKQASAGGAQGLGYGLRKSGDATVILVGFPSVGKSTLLNALTNAASKVASYEFTTLTVIPGAMSHKGVQIQILDVPGLVTGAASGKGRGKEVISVIRAADLIVLVVDAMRPKQLGEMQRELYDAGFRLDKKPPDILIKKTFRGGIRLEKTNQVKIDVEHVKNVLAEFGILNAEVRMRGKATVDDLIDNISGNCKYVPSLVLLNKVDAVESVPSIVHDLKVSALQKEGLEKLRDKIFDKLHFLRIYMKRPGKEPDYVEPAVLRKGNTIRDLCRHSGTSFLPRFRYANVTGKSAKFKNQKVGLDHKLEDEDVVTLILEE